MLPSIIKELRQFPPVICCMIEMSLFCPCTHRTIPAGWELRRSPVQPPTEVGIGLIAWDFVPPGLENLHGWCLHSLSGKPVLLLGCPHAEEVFIHIQPESPLFQFISIVSHSFSVLCWEQPGSAFSIASLQSLRGCC